MKTKIITRAAYLLPKETALEHQTCVSVATAVADRAELTGLAGWLPGVDNRPRKGAKKVLITVTVAEAP